MEISDIIRIGEMKAKIKSIDFSKYPRSFFNSDFDDTDLKNKITIGNQFFFIIDLLNFTNIYTSKSTDKILGFKMDKYPFMFGLSLIHPDDKSIIYKAIIKSIAIIELMIINKVPVYEYVFNLTYRLQTSNGSYLKFLNQNSCYRVEEKTNLLYFISSFTDITFLNTPNDVHLSITGPKSDLFKFPDDELIHLLENIPIFSKRENEILRLMYEGKTTKEISEILNISFLTAQTHRKNMLQKSGCKNSSQIISFWRRNKSL